MDCCPVCGEDAVIEDNGTDGCLQKVCAECGVIVSTSLQFTAEDFQGSGPSNWMFGGQTVPKPMQRFMQSTDSTNQLEAHKIGIQRISQNASALGFTEVMVEECKQMFSEAYRKHFLLRSTKLKLILATSSVYCVCRLHRFAVSIRHICDLAQCDPHEFGQVYKEVCRKTGLVLPSCGAGTTIAGVVNKLRWEDSSEVIQKTQKLLLLCDDNWLVTGRNPSHIIAPALFIVWTSKDFTTRRKVPFSLFCKEKKLLCNGTTKKRYKEIAMLLVELSHKIPWISAGEVSCNDVPMYLDDILKYQRSLMMDAMQGDSGTKDCQDESENGSAVIPPCIKKRRLLDCEQVSEPGPVEEDLKVFHDLDKEELTADDIDDSELVSYIRDPSEVKIICQIRKRALNS